MITIRKSLLELATAIALVALSGCAVIGPPADDISMQLARDSQSG